MTDFQTTPITLRQAVKASTFILVDWSSHSVLPMPMHEVVGLNGPVLTFRCAFYAFEAPADQEIVVLKDDWTRIQILGRNYGFQTGLRFLTTAPLPMVIK